MKIKIFQNVKLLGLNLCVSNGKAAGLKLQSLTKFSSYKPAAMKISELEKKKYRVWPSLFFFLA